MLFPSFRRIEAPIHGKHTVCRVPNVAFACVRVKMPARKKEPFPTTYATHTKEGPTTMTQEINQQLLGGERALFHAHDLRIVDTVFTLSLIHI